MKFVNKLIIMSDGYYVERKGIETESIQREEVRKAG